MSEASARPRPNDDGLGLVELIIAMFLLAIITIAILPALLNGIRYAAEQSTTATATRQLNSLIEQARTAATCTGLSTAAAAQTFKDGAGHPFTTSGSTGTCTSGAIATLNLTAKAQNGDVLATVNALVYIP